MLTLLGFRPYDYDKDGHHYEGVTIHTVDTDFTDMENAFGQGVFSKSVSCEIFEKLRNGRKNTELIGVIVDPRFNKYGRISELVEV